MHTPRRDTQKERRHKARLRLARTATNVPPGVEAVCFHCKRPGERAQMISMQRPYHTLCFRQAFGLEAVLALPYEQRGKFSSTDLPPEEMRKLLHQGKRRA